MAKKETPKPSSSPEEDMAAELLLKDVDDAMRQDQLQAFWDEWGSTIIGMALMIVFGTMIGVGWQNWRLSVHEHQTTTLIQSQVNPVLAETELNDYYGGIAKMIIAGSIISGERSPALSGALADLLSDSADAGLPKEWDILAKWGKLRTLADSGSDVDPKDYADQMVSLADKNNSPFNSIILTEAAVIKGENGDKENALSLLRKAKKNISNESDAAISDYIDSFINLYEIENAS